MLISVVQICILYAKKNGNWYETMKSYHYYFMLLFKLCFELKLSTQNNFRVCVRKINFFFLILKYCFEKMLHIENKLV